MRSAKDFFKSLSLFLSVSFTCWHSAVAQGAPLLEFAAINTAFIHDASARQQTLEAVQLDGREALKIGWNATKARYFELMLGDSSVGRLPDFVDASFTLRAYIPEGGQIRSLNLRIIDRSNEVFQFRQQVPQGASGWKDFVFAISAESAQATSWGGSASGKGVIDFPARVFGVSGDFATADGTSWLALEGIDVQVIRSENPLSLSLETGSPVHVLAVGEEAALGIVVEHAHSGQDVLDVVVGYVITDAEQLVVSAGDVQLAVREGESGVVALPIPDRLGIYYVDASVKAVGGVAKSVSRRFSFSYMPPAGPTPGLASGYLFGVCNHSQRRGSVREQELEALAAALCGVKIVREDISWERMQPNGPQEWNFSSFDRVVDIFGQYDIEFQAIYCYLPQWALAKDWKPHFPDRKGRGRPDYDYWRNFVRTFAERYKDRIRYVEVWNEPDLSGFTNFSSEEYLELLKIAYVETKAASPDMNVLIGGFAGMPEFLSGSASLKPDAVFKILSGATGYYDVVAFHGHGSFASYQRNIESFLALKDDLGITKPWYANETAETSVRIGELEQAVILYKKFLYSWARGSIGYNWYNLRNDGFSTTDGEHHFGLLTNDFYPKAAYPVYNMLANYFQGGEFIKAFDLGDGLFSYLFRDQNGDYLLANWNEAVSAQSRLVMLGGLSGSAVRVDIFGNEEPVEIIDGSCMLEISAKPFTLKLSGQSRQPVMLGETLRPVGEFLVAEDERIVFEYELINPTSVERRFELSFDLPAGLVAQQAVSEIRVAGNSRVVYQLELAKRPAFDDDEATDAATLRANFVLDGTWGGHLDSSVKRIISCPYGAFAAEPTFVLDDVSQVTTLVPSAPELSHLFWRDSADLSAKIWLMRGDASLNIKIVVTDDVHFQPFSGGQVWRGDNIQMAIKLPDQQTMWEIGLTHLSDNNAEVWCWFAPRGFSAQEAATQISLLTERNEQDKTTTYLATIPFDAIGLSVAVLQSGFRFNVLVNDNDGEMRESFIAIAPGIAFGKTPEHFPLVNFQAQNRD